VSDDTAAGGDDPTEIHTVAVTVADSLRETTTLDTDHGEITVRVVGLGASTTA